MASTLAPIHINIYTLSEFPWDWCELETTGKSFSLHSNSSLRSLMSKMKIYRNLRSRNLDSGIFHNTSTLGDAPYMWTVLFTFICFYLKWIYGLYDAIVRRAFFSSQQKMDISCSFSCSTINVDMNFFSMDVLSFYPMGTFWK